MALLVSGMGGFWGDVVGVLEAPIKTAYSTTRSAATTLYGTARSAVTAAAGNARQALPGATGGQAPQQQPAGTGVYYTPPQGSVDQPLMIPTGYPPGYQPVMGTPVPGSTNWPLILGGAGAGVALLLLLRRRRD